MMTVRVEGNVQWRVSKTKTGEWLGVCDPLKLTLVADTWAELAEDIGLALDAMLSDLLATNELDRFLHEHGWTLRNAIPESHDDLRFDIPFYLLPVNANGPQKRTYYWRKRGGTHSIFVPMRDDLPDEWVETALRQAGCSDEEIKTFLASCKS